MSVFKDAGSPFTQASVNNVVSTTEGLCGKTHTEKCTLDLALEVVFQLGMKVL